MLQEIVGPYSCVFTAVDALLFSLQQLESEASFTLADFVSPTLFILVLSV